MSLRCNVTSVGDLFCVTHLITASINCCPGVVFVLALNCAKNSLDSYLLRIHASFSSRVELGLGLVCCRVFASHTEFAKLLPMANITLR